MITELLYWLVFSVVVALAQLFLVPLAHWIWAKPVTWVVLVKNGTLLFYATTISSRAAGDYFRRVGKPNKLVSLLCVAGVISIVLPSSFVYGAVVGIALQPDVASNSPSPERIATLSVYFALAAMVFSLGYTLYVREFGD